VSESKLREQICEFGRSIFDRGLTAGSSGNISVRADDFWLMTPTNVSLGRLDPARLSKIDAQGKLLSGDPPTKELPLHLSVYEVRKPAAAIVHLHSIYSVAVSVMKNVDPKNAIPPLTAYYVMKVGRLPVVPYHRPGDPKVADAIRSLADRHAAVLLANHGPVVSGASLDGAVNAIEELEETAKLLLTLGDRPVRPLDETQIEELRRVFGAEW
jgi:ribulose-5-phosphate 4-epimerase/fuculose-1-phosphate aldolase